MDSISSARLQKDKILLGLSINVEEFMTITTQSSNNNICLVNSFNEWDPLEEIVVGRLEGATIPSHHITVTYTSPTNPHTIDLIDDELVL